MKYAVIWKGIFEYSGDSGAELQLHAELTESHRSTNFETKPFFVKMESNAWEK